MEEGNHSIIKELTAFVEGKNLDEKLYKTEQIIDCHMDCIHSIYENKEEFGYGEVYLETLHHKIIFASKSITNMSRGFPIKLQSKNYESMIIDSSSIVILVRAILESFLTLEYLYYNNLNKAEKEFRFNLFKHAGFKARNKFYKEGHPLYQTKIDREVVMIKELEESILKSPYYKTIPKNRRGSFKRWGLSRILSWEELLKFSVLRSDLWPKVYTLATNYAHSDFISMMQINEGSFGTSSPENLNQIELQLDNVRMLNSIAIELLIEKFPSASKQFEKAPQEVEIQIKSWGNIAKG